MQAAKKFESTQMEIQLKRLPHAEGLALPGYRLPLSAGMDLLAAIDQNIIMEPGEKALVSTGTLHRPPPRLRGAGAPTFRPRRQERRDRAQFPRLLTGLSTLTTPLTDSHIRSGRSSRGMTAEPPAPSARQVA